MRPREPNLHTSGYTTEALSQLVENGLLYHRSGVAPRVRVTTASTDHHWLIRVSDNGRGLDPERFHRLTELFRRDSASDGEALIHSGIGLSIARRIAERHRGRLYLERGTETGTTIVLAIRKREPSDCVPETTARDLSDSLA